MEKVTFNDLMETLDYYIDGASNPRNDGWTHNYYRKWLKEVNNKIKDAAKLPLHDEN